MMNTMGGDNIPDLDGAEEEVCMLLHRVLFICFISITATDVLFKVILSEIYHLQCMTNCLSLFLFCSMNLQTATMKVSTILKELSVQL